MFCVRGFHGLSGRVTPTGAARPGVGHVPVRSGLVCHRRAVDRDVVRKSRTRELVRVHLLRRVWGRLGVDSVGWSSRSLSHLLRNRSGWRQLRIGRQHSSRNRARLPEVYNRFLLTAAGSSRIVAKNDLHSSCPVSRRGLHFVRLLRLLHLRVSDVRPVLLTRLSD